MKLRRKTFTITISMADVFVMLADFYKAEDYIARRLAIMRQISYDNKIFPK